MLCDDDKGDETDAMQLKTQAAPFKNDINVQGSHDAIVEPNKDCLMQGGSDEMVPDTQMVT